MAKRYSEEWRQNVSKGVRKFNSTNVVSEETRSKLSAACRDNNRNRDYVRKPIEELKSWPKVRARIFEERGRVCELCGWEELNTFHNIVPVQIDHIDGDKSNNSRENLRIVCPNCHSLTEHFMNYSGRGMKSKDI